MYVLGVNLHLLVQPFGTCDFFLFVQVVQSAIFGGDVQTVVRSIDNLADSLSAQMIETGSVWIYLELVGTEYIIVDSSEIGSTYYEPCPDKGCKWENRSAHLNLVPIVRNVQSVDRVC